MKLSGSGKKMRAQTRGTSKKSTKITRYVAYFRFSKIASYRLQDNLFILTRKQRRPTQIYITMKNQRRRSSEAKGIIQVNTNSILLKKTVVFASISNCQCMWDTPKYFNSFSWLSFFSELNLPTWRNFFLSHSRLICDNRYVPNQIDAHHVHLLE